MCLYHCVCMYWRVCVFLTRHSGSPVLMEKNGCACWGTEPEKNKHTKRQTKSHYSLILLGLYCKQAPKHRQQSRAIGRDDKEEHMCIYKLMRKHRQMSKKRITTNPNPKWPVSHSPFGQCKHATTFHLKCMFVIQSVSIQKIQYEEPSQSVPLTSNACVFSLKVK